MFINFLKYYPTQNFVLRVAFLRYSNKVAAYLGIGTAKTCRMTRKNSLTIFTKN